MTILNRLLASFVKTRETSLICNPSYSIPLTVTASHNIYLRLQFASIAIPVLLKHPFKFLESNIFHKVCYFTGISFQNQQLFLLCVHSRKKPIFFHVAYTAFVKNSKTSNSMLSSNSVSIEIFHSFQLWRQPLVNHWHSSFWSALFNSEVTAW